MRAATRHAGGQTGTPITAKLRRNLFGAKREGVAQETEQLELKLEEPETRRGQ
jgi:hypothetical protein